MNKWLIYNKNIKDLDKRCKVSKEVATILVNRGIDDKEKAEKFLKPSLDNFYDPFLMKDMDRAIDLMVDAIDENKHVQIVGDYDQDGVSSTVILYKGISRFHKKLTYAVPDRVEDGYGLNVNMVDDAIKNKVDLIITCDNGISAFEAVSYAKEKGLAVIVTDHHQISLDQDGQEIIPCADAVINPHQKNCPYPFKDLCGAGVAFKFISALYLALGLEEDEANELLAYACLGTVCDVVSLLDENRVIVKEGLKRLNQGQSFGINALLTENSWNKEIDVYTIGFVIGPCINASGRLSTARLGIELFLEKDENLVRNYARELVLLNNDRKMMTQDTFDEVLVDIEKNNRNNDSIIISFAENSHESIVGIVAGRVKEKFYKPTIVLARAKEEGVLKGSGRSIDKYDMYKHIFPHKEELVSFGGHPMACGLSIREDYLDEFRNKLNSEVKLTDDDFRREISIDYKLEIDLITESFIDSLSILSPFGKDNPSPVFADKKVDLLGYKIMGKNANVLKLFLMKNGKIIEAINFSNALAIEDRIIKLFGKDRLCQYNSHNREKNLVDIVYYPKINEFMGEKKVQLNLIDLR